MSIYEDIKNNIDCKDLNELEIARLLYIELGKRVNFSTKFNNTSSSEHYQMMHADVDINTFNGKDVNCVIWSQLYSQLLYSYNIKNKIIKCGHQYVEFYCLDKIWVADATYGAYTDLSRIHNNDTPEYFGLRFHQNDNNKKIGIPRYDEKINILLNEIDNKIGYHNNKYEDLVDFKELINKIKNNDLDINSYVDGDASIIEKKLQFIFSKVGKLDVGYYEAKDYIYDLVKLLLTDEELRKVKSNELLRTNSDKSVDILQLITLINEDNNHYYLLTNNSFIREINSEDVCKLAILGYGKVEYREIPGVMYPLNFKPGFINKSLKYKLNKLANHKIIKEANLEEYDKLI